MTWASRRQLRAITSLSDSTIWRLVRDAGFPAPVRISPGRVAWPLAAVEKWMRDREAEDEAARSRAA
jgi:prophage regulatory protein